MKQSQRHGRIGAESPDEFETVVTRARNVDAATPQ